MATVELLNQLPHEIDTKICIHRGLGGKEENTAAAIEQALLLNPYHVEFDVNYVNGSFRSGHPPHIIEDEEGRLDIILGKYNEHAKTEGRTFPKIDLRLQPGQDCESVIVELLDILESYEYIPFYLINIGEGDECNIETCMSAERFLAQQIRERQANARINIDIAKYRGVCEAEISRHVKKLGICVLSISPEINESDWDATAKFAEEHDVKEIHFWLRGLPDCSNPSISIDELRQTLRWVEHKGISVYFDINPAYIKN